MYVGTPGLQDALLSLNSPLTTKWSRPLRWPIKALRRLRKPRLKAYCRSGGVEVTLSQALVGYWTCFSIGIAASDEFKDINHGNLPIAYKFSFEDLVLVYTVP
jgi:hypothetical protein